MAKRDFSGAVDFAYLENFAAGDMGVVDEVLEIFREQLAIWSRMLAPEADGWRDAVHTIKGAARGVGAFALGEACARAETEGAAALADVHFAMDAALADVAAYAHERALRALKTRP